MTVAEEAAAGARRVDWRGGGAADAEAAAAGGAAAVTTAVGDKAAVEGALRGLKGLALGRIAQGQVRFDL